MALSNGGHQLIRGGPAQADRVGVPFWNAPGFAIPLFQKSDYSNAYYVQRVNSSHKISGFDTLEETPYTVPLDLACRADVGDPEVFALVDPSAVAHAGTRAKLSRIVKTWVTKIDAPLLRMSFARFCGDKRLAERAAIEAVRMKASELQSEDQAVRWFIDAVVLTELLTTLASSNGGERSRIRTNVLENTGVAVHLRSNLRIQIEVPRFLLQRESNNYRGKMATLLGLVYTATGREVDITSLEEKKGSQQTRETVALVREATISERAKQILEEMRQCSRQERRVAVLIEALISDRAAALKVLKDYSDRAAFAQNALNHLRNTQNSKETNDDFLRQIETSVSAIITAAYPLQRGKLLLDFAQVLGRHRSLSKIIRDRTLRSGSRDVAILREAILSELG